MQNSDGSWQSSGKGQTRKGSWKNSDESRETFRAEGRFALYRQNGWNYIQSKTAAGNDPCRAITPEMAEWRLWELYFRKHYNDLPWEMKQVLSGRLPSMTVPDISAKDFSAYEEAIFQHERNLGRDPKQLVAPPRKPYRPVERVKGGRDIPDSTRALIAKLTGNDAYLRS